MIANNKNEQFYTKIKNFQLRNAGIINERVSKPDMSYTDFFGKKVSHEDAAMDSIKNLLIDICMEEQGVSEKSFRQVDEISDKVKLFLSSKQDQILSSVNEFCKNGRRLKLLAEELYEEIADSEKRANESLIVGIGIAYLTLAGANKLLKLIRNRVIDRSVKNFIEVFATHEDQSKISVSESDDYFTIKLDTESEDIGMKEMVMKLMKSTKELILPSESVAKLSDRDYEDFLLIAKYYSSRK